MQKAYFANYPISEEQWHTDVHDFDAKPYKGKVDLFVGGAPCQAFSLRGKHGGFEDTRGSLFREFARIVIECQPKVFIFENVKGMLSHDKGKTWKIIKETFENDCDYDVYYQVLMAKIMVYHKVVNASIVLDLKRDRFQISSTNTFGENSV